MRVALSNQDRERHTEVVLSAGENTQRVLVQHRQWHLRILAAGQAMKNV